MPPDATTAVRLARTRTVDLVAIGRKTGQPRRVETGGSTSKTGSSSPARPDDVIGTPTSSPTPGVVIETLTETSGQSLDRLRPAVQEPLLLPRCLPLVLDPAELDALVETAPMIEVRLD